MFSVTMSSHFNLMGERRNSNKACKYFLILLKRCDNSCPDQLARLIDDLLFPDLIDPQVSVLRGSNPKRSPTG